MFTGLDNFPGNQETFRASLPYLVGNYILSLPSLPSLIINCLLPFLPFSLLICPFHLVLPDFSKQSAKRILTVTEQTKHFAF